LVGWLVGWLVKPGNCVIDFLDSNRVRTQRVSIAVQDVPFVHRSTLLNRTIDAPMVSARVRLCQYERYSPEKVPE